MTTTIYDDDHTDDPDTDRATAQRRMLAALPQETVERTRLMEQLRLGQRVSMRRVEQEVKRQMALMA